MISEQANLHAGIWLHDQWLSAFYPRAGTWPWQRRCRTKGAAPFVSTFTCYWWMVKVDLNALVIQHLGFIHSCWPTLLCFTSIGSSSIMRISSEQANGTSTDRHEWQAEEENHWQVREPSMFLFVPGFFTYDQIRRTYTTCDEGLQALNSHKLLQVLLKILSFNGASISCCMLDSSLS